MTQSHRRSLRYLVVLFTASGCRPTHDSIETSAGEIEVAPGVQLHYSARGAGADTVLVPLGVFLEQALAPLAEDRTLIFYDVRSRGRSATVNDATKLGLNEEVEDLDRVRRHFRIAHPSVIGFSYMGAAAALFAARHPGVAKRIVLLGPLAPQAAIVAKAQGNVIARLDSSSVQRLTKKLAMPAAAREEERETCVEFWKTYANAYMASGHAELAERTMNPTCDISNETPRSFNRVLAAVFVNVGAWDWQAAADSISAPVLIIEGSDDVVAPASGGAAWAAHIRESRILTVPDAGHLAWAEHPEAVREAIWTFLRGNWPRGARRE